MRDISGAVVISEAERFAFTLGPTIDELVRVARDAGLTQANRRTIRGMVEQRFLASPRRVGRSWCYQKVALGQVDVVTRCRVRRIDHELTRLALFVETGTGDIEQITALGCRLLRGWQEELAADLERLQADPSALPDEAARAARIRRSPPLPRRVRMRLEDRELAVLYAFTRMVGTPLSDREAQGEFQLLRALGLKSGHGRPIAELSDLMPSEGEWPPRPGTLAEALASAGGERIELGRRLAEFALIWTPALRSVWLAELGAGGVALVDILATWSQHVSPTLCVMMLAAFVSGGLAASDEEIREGLSQFEPEVAALQLLADRPAAEWKLAADRLPPYPRMRFVTVARAIGVAPSDWYRTHTGER